MGNSSSADGPNPMNYGGDPSMITSRHVLRPLLFHHYRRSLFVVDYHELMHWIHKKFSLHGRRHQMRKRWVEHLEAQRARFIAPDPQHHSGPPQTNDKTSTDLPPLPCPSLQGTNSQQQGCSVRATTQSPKVAADAPPDLAHAYSLEVGLLSMESISHENSLLAAPEHFTFAGADDEKHSELRGGRTSSQAASSSSALSSTPASEEAPGAPTERKPCGCRGKCRCIVSGKAVRNLITFLKRACDAVLERVKNGAYHTNALAVALLSNAALPTKKTVKNPRDALHALAALHQTRQVHLQTFGIGAVFDSPMDSEGLRAHALALLLRSSEEAVTAALETLASVQPLFHALVAYLNGTLDEEARAAVDPVTAAEVATMARLVARADARLQADMDGAAVRDDRRGVRGATGFAGSNAGVTATAANAEGTTRVLRERNLEQERESLRLSRDTEPRLTGSSNLTAEDSLPIAGSLPPQPLPTVVPSASADVPPPVTTPDMDARTSTMTQPPLPLRTELQQELRDNLPHDTQTVVPTPLPMSVPVPLSAPAPATSSTLAPSPALPVAPLLHAGSGVEVLPLANAPLPLTSLGLRMPSNSESAPLTAIGVRAPAPAVPMSSAVGVAALSSASSRSAPSAGSLPRSQSSSYASPSLSAQSLPRQGQPLGVTLPSSARSSSGYSQGRAENAPVMQLYSHLHNIGAVPPASIRAGTCSPTHKYSPSQRAGALPGSSPSPALSTRSYTTHTTHTTHTSQASQASITPAQAHAHALACYNKVHSPKPKRANSNCATPATDASTTPSPALLLRPLGEAATSSSGGPLGQSPPPILPPTSPHQHGAATERHRRARTPPTAISPALLYTGLAATFLPAAAASATITGLSPTDDAPAPPLSTTLDVFSPLEASVPPDTPTAAATQELPALELAPVYPYSTPSPTPAPAPVLVPAPTPNAASTPLPPPPGPPQPVTPTTPQRTRPRHLHIDGSLAHRLASSPSHKQKSPRSPLQAHPDAPHHSRSPGGRAHSRTDRRGPSRADATDARLGSTAKTRQATQLQRTTSGGSEDGSIRRAGEATATDTYARTPYARSPVPSHSPPADGYRLSSLGGVGVGDGSLGLLPRGGTQEAKLAALRRELSAELDDENDLLIESLLPPQRQQDALPAPALLPHKGSLKAHPNFREHGDRNQPRKQTLSHQLSRARQALHAVQQHRLAQEREREKGSARNSGRGVPRQPSDRSDGSRNSGKMSRQDLAAAVTAITAATEASTAGKESVKPPSPASARVQRENSKALAPAAWGTPDAQLRKPTEPIAQSRPTQAAHGTSEPASASGRPSSAFTFTNLSPADPNDPSLPSRSVQPSTAQPTPTAQDALPREQPHDALSSGRNPPRLSQSPAPLSPQSALHGPFRASTQATDAQTGETRTTDKSRGIPSTGSGPNSSTSVPSAQLLSSASPSPHSSAVPSPLFPTSPAPTESPIFFSTSPLPPGGASPTDSGTPVPETEEERRERRKREKREKKEKKERREREKDGDKAKSRDRERGKDRDREKEKERDISRGREREREDKRSRKKHDALQGAPPPMLSPMLVDSPHGPSLYAAQHAHRGSRSNSAVRMFPSPLTISPPNVVMPNAPSVPAQAKRTTSSDLRALITTFPDAERSRSRSQPRSRNHSSESGRHSLSRKDSLSRKESMSRKDSLSRKDGDARRLSGSRGDDGTCADGDSQCWNPAAQPFACRGDGHYAFNFPDYLEPDERMAWESQGEYSRPPVVDFSDSESDTDILDDYITDLAIHARIPLRTIPLMPIEHPWPWPVEPLRAEQAREEKERREKRRVEKEKEERERKERKAREKEKKDKEKKEKKERKDKEREREKDKKEKERARSKEAPSSGLVSARQGYVQEVSVNADHIAEVFAENEKGKSKGGGGLLGCFSCTRAPQEAVENNMAPRRATPYGLSVDDSARPRREELSLSALPHAVQYEQASSDLPVTAVAIPVEVDHDIGNLDCLASSWSMPQSHPFAPPLYTPPLNTTPSRSAVLEKLEREKKEMERLERELQEKEKSPPKLSFKYPVPSGAERIPPHTFFSDAMLAETRLPHGDACEDDVALLQLYVSDGSGKQTFAGSPRSMSARRDRQFSARSNPNAHALPPLSPTLGAQNPGLSRSSMVVGETARSRQNSARLGSMLTGSSLHNNAGMLSQRSGNMRHQAPERNDTPWIEFAMEPLRAPADKHPMVRAQVMRSYVRELFPHYSTVRRGGRVMQREEAMRLVVDLHSLVLNEGLRLFEHQLMRLLLKFTFNIDTALLAAITIPAVMDGKIPVSFPPSESVLRPYNLLARQLLRSCTHWLKNTFVHERALRAAYSREQMVEVAEVAWRKIDVGNSGAVKETQFMYYLQDVMDLVVPTQRYSDAIRTVYRDLEKLTLEYNTKS